MILVAELLIIISLGFGANYYQPDLHLLNRVQNSHNALNITETLRMVGIMAQFDLEVIDNAKTSGNGQFLSQEYDVKFIDTDSNRCNGMLVDPPPHTSTYFQKQLEAGGNYYEEVSFQALPFTANIIENPNNIHGYYTVSNQMEYYAKSDQLLAELFSEVLSLAKSDIENYFINNNIVTEDVVFVLFHAGLGQDFSLPGLDPTIYDLKSAYIDDKMMEGVVPETILGTPVSTGILLPETQNMIYFDIVEDIFGNPDYGTTSLCDIQLGLTGIITFLLGYQLGLPPMFNTENGDPGVGFFGLMDHGSNNGRGVIPSPPVPFTRSIISGWTEIIQIDTMQYLDSILIEAYDLSNKLYKLDISADEYFLIENRNNYIIPGYDLEYLQYLLGDNYLCNNCQLNCDGLDISEIMNNRNIIDVCVKNKPFTSDKLNYFDLLETLSTQSELLNIEIEIENNIFTGFSNYDLGLPGSGILIWHITDRNISSEIDGINNNPNNRAVHIEEADGVVDIGFESHAFFDSDNPTIGTKWDMWYLGNPDYEYANFGTNQIVFDNWSNPNSRTNSGAESFISIQVLSEISDSMYIKIKYTEELEIENLSNELINYLGNSYSAEDSLAYIYYEQNNIIYKHSIHGVEISEYDYLAEYEILSLNNTQTLYSIAGSWLDDSMQVHQDSVLPKGYINQSDSLSIIESEFINLSSSISLGDIDQDGLDEIITIQDGNIFANNDNRTLVNGFPVKGKFYDVPLIANIIDIADNKPEIICREGNEIIIISHKGERLRTLSSFDINQPIAMIPYWNNKMALLDGNRLILFDLDLDRSYWLNPKSRPSNYPVPIGKHDHKGYSQSIRKNAYNYPNPIADGRTTFRFFIHNPKTSEVKIHIYDAAGYLVIDNLVKKDLKHFEFNEIKWDASQMDSGLYFAEIKPNIGSSEMVKLVVIK